MKLVSFSTSDGRVRPGSLLEDGNLVVDLTSAGFDGTLAAISAGFGAHDRAASLPAYPIDDVRLHAPLPNPPRIFAIGLNYRDHARESGMELPTTPVVFFKLTTSAWRDHVYGYTIVNDVSARDVQFASTQWSMSKSFPTFCPLGPAIVTANEIADPHHLDIGLSIDGETLQASNTSELVFKVPELVEYLSSITPLLPGDIVSTGTPPGVGLGRTPRRWLKPGESVTVTVQGLGWLTNPVAAE